MGVLKVNVGTALAPDWRNVGCGDPTGVDLSNVWGYYNYTEYDATQPAVEWRTVAARSAQHLSDSGNNLMHWRLLNGARSALLYPVGTTVYFECYLKVFSTDTSGASFTAEMRMADINTGTSAGTMQGSTSINTSTWTKFSGTAVTPTNAGIVIDSTAGVYLPSGYTLIVSDWTTNAGTAFVAPTGRLKLQLPDGSWVREKCDDDLSYGPFTDTFTRADSSTTLGYPWQTLTSGTPGVWGVDAGRAYSITTSSQEPYGSVVDAGTGDVTMSVDLPVIGASFAEGLVFRSNSTGTNYWIVTQERIYKVTGGTFTAVGALYSMTAPVTLAVTLSGSSITVTANGSTLLSTTDSTWATNTLHGIRSASSSTRFDNFSISSAPIAHRPLRVWDGSAWQTVACMVPA